MSNARRVLHRLTAASLTKLGAGLHSDGGGLYLNVKPGASEHVGRSWVFRYTIDGRERRMGLGPLSLVSMREARELARAAQRALYDGEDPLVAKRERQREARASRREANQRSRTFAEVAQEAIEARRDAWKNQKHAAQWLSTLSTYAFPHFGDVEIEHVDQAHVLAALEPIWRTKTETASRLRSRIEIVLNYAIAHGMREGPNPAQWRGRLEHILASPTRLNGKRHFASMPYREVPAFVAALRDKDSTSAAALELLILTACRSNEVRGARWDEIDEARGLWIIPAERMKGEAHSAQEHRVPLSPRCLEILKARSAFLDPAGLVFPSDQRADSPMSDATLGALMRRMGVPRAAATVHGFRASFKTWAAEEHDAPDELSEAALAHKQGKLHQSYQRGDLLDRRRALMDAWAAYTAQEARE